MFGKPLIGRPGSYTQSGPYTILELSDDETGTLAERLASVRASPSSQFESFEMDVAGIMNSSAPKQLMHLLQTLRSRSTETSAALVKNAPLPQALPPTPTGEPIMSACNPMSTGFLVGCGQTLGTIYGFANERNGGLIHDIVSNEHKAESLSSAGSRVALGLHSEVAFHEMRPDFILLSCLRNSHAASAATLVVDAAACLESMAVTDVRQLERPVFEFRVPQSFLASEAIRSSRMLPVVARQPYGWDVRINCNPGHTTTADRAAARALDRFKGVLSAAVRRISLSPGDVLILDNRRCLHGREAYEADYGGTGRWLQRIYVAFTPVERNSQDPPVRIQG
jgi:L-asparagine oxygenase